MEGLMTDQNPERGRVASEAAGSAPPENVAPSPYTRADLYDLMFNSYDADLDFYLGAAKRAGGPVLDVACGTGRVLLPCLAAGIDADGVDNAAAMLDRLRLNARARGLAPRVELADMRDFRMPRRYAFVMIPFNAFAHNLTGDDQIAALSCCHDHLLPGGRLVFDAFSATQSMLANPVAPPVLELEISHPETGFPVRLYDGRHLDPATQTQHSQIEIQELGAGGEVVHSHRFVTVVRWTYPSEMNLLLRLAGFARWEISGGLDGRPVAEHEGSLMVSAWRD
jgi:SAM-dependent methyltransferase